MKSTLKERRYAFGMALVVLTIFFMGGLWAIDVATGAMNLNHYLIGLGEEPKTKAGGLGFLRDPINHYHIGLGVVAITYLITIATAIWAFFIRGSKCVRCKKELD